MVAESDPDSVKGKHPTSRWQTLKADFLLVAIFQYTKYVRVTDGMHSYRDG